MRLQSRLPLFLSPPPPTPPARKMTWESKYKKRNKKYSATKLVPPVTRQMELWNRGQCWSKSKDMRSLEVGHN
jgi:hypothetical protein